METIIETDLDKFKLYHNEFHFIILKTCLISYRFLIKEYKKNPLNAEKIKIIREKEENIKIQILKIKDKK